jgi:hypothetical protein
LTPEAAKAINSFSEKEKTFFSSKSDWRTKWKRTDLVEKRNAETRV